MEPLNVVCPSGVAPGDLITVEAHGQAYEVVVPDGVEPGATFLVTPEGDETAESDVDLEGLAADLAKRAAAPSDEPAAPASSLRRLTSADAATIRSIMEALFDADEIDDWIDDNAAAFASYCRDGEQQLCWTSLHQRFQALVEATIHDQLHDLGATVEQLCAPPHPQTAPVLACLTRARGKWQTACWHRQRAATRVP